MIRAIQPQANPFPYGWRYVQRQLPDGRTDFDQVPLTLEDVLHPQMGDVMPQNPPHEDDRLYLFAVLKNRTGADPTALVRSDYLIIWDIPGLKQHSPDLSVFYDVDDPEALRTSFKVAEEGIRPTLLIEIVSPDYRNNDVETKVDHYYRAGVPCYVIVDRKHAEGPVQLIGYHHGPAGYEKMAPDEQGRLWLEDVEISLGARDNRVVCFDSDGNEIGDYDVIEQGRRAADARAAEETRARHAADARAADEALARLAADARAADAEAKARQEAQARADAETRIRELEEKLRRLQAIEDTNG